MLVAAVVLVGYVELVERIGFAGGAVLVVGAVTVALPRIAGTVQLVVGVVLVVRIVLVLKVPLRH